MTVAPPTWRGGTPQQRCGPARLYSSGVDDLTHDPRASQATRANPLALVLWLAEGPRVERLGDEPLVIGRAAPADLVVAEATLSREHARVQPFHGGVRIDDLDSKNGLHFRGQRVASAELFPGDTCELGDLRVSVTSLSRTIPADRAVRSADPLDRLDLELVAARTLGRPLAIALVDPVPNAVEVRAALSRSLRAVDVLGTYAGTLVLVVVAQGDVSSATRLVEGALGGGARAGIATYPPIEPDVHLMLAAARDALATAGAGCVAIAAPRVAPPQTLVAASPRMRAVLAELERWAPSALPVLVRGETGTGKEVVAREIHRLSGRTGPFQAINCGASPDAESFEKAAGGTVFLDEISELSLAAQAALLRVLDRDRVDARIIAATRRDLDEMVKAGTFRDDLLYRLDPLSVTLPPLRERPDDLLVLADRFLREACAASGTEILAMDGAALQVLLDHGWPGNVRELRTTVERAVLVATGRSIGVAELPERLRATADVRDDEPARDLANVADAASVDAASVGADAEADGAVDELDTGTGALRDRLRELEIRLIMRALDQAKGNQGLAAKLLGLPKRTLVYKLARFGLRRVGRYELSD